ncbi:hypothetical protein NHQ30_007063 [Ciborinia camelliae]|nr:hypothetical protein NHQ30_007063 [Ciborinia camelliae]
MYELWWSTFHDDAKLKDAEPEKIFEEMILTPDDFESRVRLWHEEVERRWLWGKWTQKSREKMLHTIDSPADVFTGPRFDKHGNAITGLQPWTIYMPPNDFNKAHPWVQAILDDMPHFRSVIIMVRYCRAKCYKFISGIHITVADSNGHDEIMINAQDMKLYTVPPEIMKRHD